jgi:hypothetical protein
MDNIKTYNIKIVSDIFPNRRLGYKNSGRRQKGIDFVRKASENVYLRCFYSLPFQLYPLSAFACKRIYRILCRRTLTIISGGHSTSPEVVVEKEKKGKEEKEKAKKK